MPSKNYWGVEDSKALVKKKKMPPTTNTTKNKMPPKRRVVGDKQARRQTPSTIAQGRSGFPGCKNSGSVTSFPSQPRHKNYPVLSVVCCCFFASRYNSWNASSTG